MLGEHSCGHCWSYSLYKANVHQTRARVFLYTKSRFGGLVLHGKSQKTTWVFTYHALAWIQFIHRVSNGWVASYKRATFKPVTNLECHESVKSFWRALYHSAWGGMCLFTKPTRLYVPNSPDMNVKILETFLSMTFLFHIQNIWN